MGNSPISIIFIMLFATPFLFISIFMINVHVLSNFSYNQPNVSMLL